MSQGLRALGVAVLAVALLDASAGLCFCHRGPALPGGARDSGGCCHGPAPSGTTAAAAAGNCCHVESAESEATPVVVVQLAPPAAVATAIAVEAPTGATVPVTTTVLIGSSPPLFVLRI